MLEETFGGGGEPPAPAAAAKAVETTFDARVGFDAAPLATPAETSARGRIRAELSAATRTLVKALRAGGYRFAGFEERFETEVDGIPLVGFIDCLVVKEGAEAVIDFKYSGARYHDALRDGTAVQLATYAAARAAAGGVEPAVAYLLLSSARLLTPEGSALAGAERSQVVTGGPAIRSVWKDFARAIRATAGWLEGAEPVPAWPLVDPEAWPEGVTLLLDGKADGQQTCRWCDYDLLCGLTEVRSMSRTLTVVRAGAGTGKTHRVCEEIAAEIARGLDPALVLATTFTRKAAAELEGRVLARILEDPTIPAEEKSEKAERLELAAIGTVHAVGHRFLSRHALALGLSPRLQVMEEGREERHLRRLLAEAGGGGFEGLADVAGRLGIEDLRGIILELLGKKRANDIPAKHFRTQILAGGERLCAVLLGPAGAEEDGGPEDLYGAAETALGKLAKVADTTKTTAEAISGLRRLVDRRRGCWQDFVVAAKLGAGKRSGADGCLADVRATGARVRRLGRLHADVREFTRRLADTVLSLSAAYASYKAERGLLDYTDLEVLFLRLLETPELEPDLRASISLVVVDEFQDTNPLQLAIFTHLADLAKRSVWVGDAKQAIYGFRGTDSELLRQVFDAVPPDSRERLPDNYRSQEGLVRLVGALFEPLFGEEASLRPKNPAAPRGVERWLLEARNRDGDAAALATGVRELIGEGIPAAKIAVLTRTNDRAQTVARALAAVGVPAALPLPGLFGTREGALVLAGLRLVADRRDGVAAATILHLLTARPECDPDWFSARLREAAEGPGAPFGDHPLLAPLEAIDARTLTPSEVVSAVAGALDLPALLPSAGSASRRSQNLDAILAAARACEVESRDLGVSATLSGLITEFEDIAEDESDLAPAPRGTDAVTVVTYHSAKGLQWPVVVLTDLDYERDPDLFRPAVGGGEAKQGRPLAGRAVRFWPWPFGKGVWGALTTGSGLEDDAFETPEGREALRLADAEAGRLLYVACTRAREKLVFAHRPGKCAWLATLPDVDDLLPPGAGPGEHPLPGLATSFVMRRLPADAPRPPTCRRRNRGS